MCESGMHKRILKFPLAYDRQFNSQVSVSFDPDKCHVHVVELSGNSERCKVYIDNIVYDVALSSQEVIDALLEQGKYERYE